jgi:hypothetical protein
MENQMAVQMVAWKVELTVVLTVERRADKMVGVMDGMMVNC